VHMSGAHFGDYHRLLDEQTTELFDATDAVAERARKIGETTLGAIRGTPVQTADGPDGLSRTTTRETEGASSGYILPNLAAHVDLCPDRQPSVNWNG
jgi:hypothetical protein